MDEEEEQALREIEEARARFDRTVDKITNHTYHAIGSAITLWSEMEGMLVQMASWLLDAHIQKVGLIFYSINNFHTWLSIMGDLFAIDPAFDSIKSDWNKIAERLKGLNDARVRLAHHALKEGRDFIEIAENELDHLDAFPTLRPNSADVRAKWKKKTAIGIREIMDFQEEVIAVVEQLTDLVRRTDPIYVGPKRRLVANIKELQRKAALWDAHEKSQGPVPDKS
jgi:hypothetical protein